VRGYLGVALVLIGLAVIAVDVPGLDVVVLTLSPGTGLHLSDALGGLCVAVGTVFVWFRRPG
jgi:hypothetical protein